MAQEINKVVTFRAPSIGDALMAKYLFDNIHAAYPHARFCLVVPRHGAMVRDLLAAYPWIEVVEASHRNLPGAWRLMREFWSSDLVVAPYTQGVVTLPTKLVARLLARRGSLIGFADKSSNTKFFYDTMLPRYTRDDAPRLLEQKILKAAHIPVSKEWMTYEHTHRDEVLSRYNLVLGSYIIVHLFSGSPGRGLAPERQQVLIDELVRTFPGTPLVFTGTPRDHALVRQLSLPPGAVLPDTSVQELAALIEHSRGMVSVGTGPSHMASILRTPLAVFCLCQGVEWAGVRQYGDAPIQVFSRGDLCTGGEHRCLNGVDMAEVAHCALSLFAPIQREQHA